MQTKMQTKKAKKRDLQPWLDYFDMLRAYVEKGFLEVTPEKHEAYITLPALYAMSEGDNPRQQLKETIPETTKRIRAYAGWKSQEGADYLVQPFALHVVTELSPHEMLHTILLTRRRPWWKPWRKTDRFEMIDYTDNNDKRS